MKRTTESRNRRRSAHPCYRGCSGIPGKSDLAVKLGMEGEGRNRFLALDPASALAAAAGRMSIPGGGRGIPGFIARWAW